jgi:hypothetical protein
MAGQRGTSQDRTFTQSHHFNRHSCANDSPSLQSIGSDRLLGRAFSTAALFPPSSTNITPSPTTSQQGRSATRQTSVAPQQQPRRGRMNHPKPPPPKSRLRPRPRSPGRLGDVPPAPPSRRQRPAPPPPPPPRRRRRSSRSSTRSKTARPSRSASATPRTRMTTTTSPAPSSRRTMRPYQARWRTARSARSASR